MADIHLVLFTPLIEMLDSLDSAEVCACHALAERHAHPPNHAMAAMWRAKSDELLANAIGWAARTNG